MSVFWPIYSLHDVQSLCAEHLSLLCPDFLLAEAKFQSPLTVWGERDEFQDLYFEVPSFPYGWFGQSVVQWCPLGVGLCECLLWSQVPDQGFVYVAKVPLEMLQHGSLGLFNILNFARLASYCID